MRCPVCGTVVRIPVDVWAWHISSRGVRCEGPMHAPIVSDRDRFGEPAPRAEHSP